MHDSLFVVFWLFMLSCGILICVFLRSRGVSSTYIRDFLHISTGCWIFGWPYWSSPLFPIVIVSTALAAILLVPLLTGRRKLFKNFINSVSGNGEKWTGIVLYVFSYAVFTALGFCFSPLPAACALAALSFGDGGGGLVGRQFGVAKYRAPWAKEKTWVGSCAVALAAGVGMGAVVLCAGMEISLQRLIITAAIAALAEALSPVSSDNIFTPAAVYLSLIL